MRADMRTQVGIVGAGPAGLLLSHLLALRGIDSVLVESRSREYCEARQRAGVLEAGSVALLRQAGLASRLNQEGIEHGGIYLQFAGERRHVDFRDLAGRTVTVYAQTEVVKDVIVRRLADGGAVEFGVTGTEVAGLDTDHPVLRYTDATDELIYARHRRGFALHSLRSPVTSRLYLQVSSDEKIDEWPDERIWDELDRRFELPGWSLHHGPVLDKGITPMRSFVAAPMRYGRLFLAGDAAHIVPPTGAKGLNLALADVAVLAPALDRLLRGDPSLADAYSRTCLDRVWRSTHFSWWMTTMLHRTSAADNMEAELQLAQLRYVTSSRAAATSLAENYTGYPDLTARTHLT